ncbi:hypothetical protein TRFO_19428 [Tritrichomonas foetus]|uniref:Uncharacterized protein n=1 Tax=Tritrichomonas foetus TaxID=1144522 RepID=A0A1J4KII3_9EUKA|nr:hypothetical protein TRFO_19428 [Tritrichomonas foetus]|eukprot:OHT11035.1 hypothetical protein TRFO_19428 [Tritrichomonas foetus]
MDDFLPPLTNMFSISQHDPERFEYLNSLVYDEIRAITIIEYETQLRTESFFQNANEGACFDPIFIEFFSRSQARIDDLQSRIERLNAGGEPTEEEKNELNHHIEIANAFFSGINEPLLKNFSLVEEQTEALTQNMIPSQIALLENEMASNVDLKRKIEELRTQAVKKPKKGRKKAK